jgi:mono/diheme cytochrome c family protein
MSATRFFRFAVGFCGVLALATGVLAFFAWQPAIAPVKPPAATSFPPEMVKRGAELVALGNCAACHTAPGGREFAGGLALPTPFGTIYSTNITPEPETGIGNWSETAFQRAMRDGVRRDGAYLYPAFPYDHFTLVADDDNRALYAFVMTRAPVRAAAPDNRLPFPLNVRLALFGWNVLFLHHGAYHADPAHDAVWNRGAYLADGLAHCGACHTPRNGLGAEKASEKFAGSAVEGWTAYALNGASPAPVAWNADTIFQYLRDGFQEQHGVARGPMAQVASNLHAAPEQDVRAIATYIAAQMGNTVPGPQAAQQARTQSERGKAIAAASADSQADATSAGGANDEGALIYAAACAGCHQGPRAIPFGGIDLALSSGINGPRPDNLINIVLNGLPAVENARTPIMPGFASAIDDNQLVALVRYLRARLTDKGPWSDLEQSVRGARSAERAAAAGRVSVHEPSFSTQRVSDETQR